MKIFRKKVGLELFDCGPASRVTRGMTIGFFYEGAPPPFNWTTWGG